MASRLFGNSSSVNSVKFFEIRRGETLAVGNYEWPFDYVLPGDTPESVEGLDDSWIIYRMKATIDRGFLAQNVLARKHVRIIRTLDTAALELSHEMVVSPVKGTPTKGVVFGTTVEAKFRISPLIKGLRVGEVIFRIIETQDMLIDPRPQETRRGRKTKVNRDVVEDRSIFPQDLETTLVNGQDSWVYSRQLVLPKSLRECLQTVDALNIKVKHRLQFDIQLINPDEHTSALHASLPLHIYISPDLPPDEHNNIAVQSLQGTEANAFAVGAPPLYGEHRLDILYDGLDPAAYLTPAGGLSAIGTPFNSQSRRGSADNLASLDAATPVGVPPTALQNRLHILDDSRNIHDASACTPLPSSNDEGLLIVSQRHQAGDSSPGAINDTEGQQAPAGIWDRRLSDDGSENSGTGPQHFEYSQEAMCKVPSYSTALRSHPQTPLNEVPPAYRTCR
ncbi:MAG: hypothetical protein Q9222_006282 [Ikaeria aurantiellina]